MLFFLLAGGACSGWTITSYCCSVIGGSEAIRRCRLYWLVSMLSNHRATTSSSFNSLPWVSHVNALLVMSAVKGGSTGTAGEGGSHGELQIGQHWRRGFEAPKTGGGVARGAARAELIDWSSHTALACQHPVSIYVTLSAYYRGWYARQYSGPVSIQDTLSAVTVSVSPPPVIIPTDNSNT